MKAETMLVVDDAQLNLFGLRDLMQDLGARVRSLLPARRAAEGLESAEALFLALGRVIEARDPSTEGHCERLARYATALGASLNLQQPDLDLLHRGGFLHDIGKIGIPDRVLLKKARLTVSEYELMKCHPVIGDELCRTLRSFEGVRCIIRHHHERLDGNGYPDRLAGDRIPLLAQIVTVVDVFDALTTHRPYRLAMSFPAAYDILRTESREGAYSVDLVERFIDLHRGGALRVPAAAARSTPLVIPAAAFSPNRRARARLEPTARSRRR
jgi:putative two-component system response regulator